MILPELLMPAGSLSKLRVALAYGADAVFVGASGLSMRPDEASFTTNELKEAVEYTHSHRKKIYVGINTLMFQEDLAELEQWLIETKTILFDAVIVSDTGAFSLVKKLRPELKIHISTQMSTANSLAADFWKKAGASRVVLARECTLENAKEISRKSGLEVEIFVHGAMCVAISGRCLLSAHLCGQSGSKGKCKHTCRWEWQLVEQKRPGEVFSAFETGRETIFLGSKDLCLIEHIPQIVKKRIRSIKIEGRMKSEYYVATIARVYRAALDIYAKDPEKYKTNQIWLDELNAVSHRPYSTGFAFGYPSDQPQTLQAHSSATTTCETLGYVKSIIEEKHEISIKNPFAIGEEVEWIGPNMTGSFVTVKGIYNENAKRLLKSHCGTTMTVSFNENICLPAYSVLRRRKKQHLSEDS
ncbi:MAG: U32 family peptidase C-terminal domain-containing protein [Candidatus Theseobacter exili]|nr:U32 family peptidase C-terminal domain-containing protein [Candidatus Theseobacter exili]